jgi:sortase A
MRNPDPTQRARRGPLVQILIVGGVLLILAGGLLMYPYVRSCFPSSHPTLPVTPSTRSTSAGKASPIDVPTVEQAFEFAPTFAPTPTPTPIPAIPDRVFISAIDLDAPVVPVTQTVIWVGGKKQPTFEIPDMRAAGWHVTSASLGRPGNTVLNGHNTGNGEVFRDLHELEEEDRILIYSGQSLYLYAVAEILILPEAGQPLEVRLENASYIQPSADERLTFVTCHPYGSVRNRLVVVAFPVESGD